MHVRSPHGVRGMPATSTYVYAAITPIGVPPRYDFEKRRIEDDASVGAMFRLIGARCGRMGPDGFAVYAGWQTAQADGSLASVVKVNTETMTAAWTYNLGATSPGQGLTEHLAIDDDGSIYLVGMDTHPASRGITKLDANGNLVWMVPHAGSHYAVDVVADHLYVPGPDPLHGVQKRRKSDGALVWHVGVDRAAAIRSRADHLYVSMGVGLAKLDKENGATLAGFTFVNGGSAVAIDVDAEGNVYACGGRDDNPPDDPYGNAIRFHNIWKFDADLATKLASGYTTTTGPLSLSIDDEGDVWTGGTPGLFLTGSSIPRQPIQRFSPDLLTVDHFGSTSAYVFDVFRTYRSWA